MNQYRLYEWLKNEYIQHGAIYDMQHVKDKYKNLGLSDKEIIDGYVDIYYFALSNLRNIYG
ncbi:hypothetical protein [Bacillus sp. CECT 9360]|uniref:hypothetical protein n=1 Tax=Bacillus sp. CECT 9360 TaxID=2845821 RepID=UPI001E4BAACF|nr:hypothetical protein [Bacillus sp. CECT 9360]CAH0347703.1 hypothetical protein BCI9360_04126 [Bacillus sp. CECT 9360]